MKITFGKFILRSIKYLVLMNVILVILCAIFDADFEPTLIGNVIVPIICADASLWAEKRRFDKKWMAR